MYSLTLNLNVELERALQQIAEREGKNTPEIILMAVQQFVQQYQATHDDPWANPSLELPSIDTGITDFAHNHDYHLYGMTDKNWGLVDCSSIVIAQQMQIEEIFTADHHFEQAGFQILLK